MAFVPVENVAEVELRMRLANQRCENTLYVQKDTAWGVDDLTALASTMRDWWGTKYASLVSSQVFLNEIQVTDLTTATSAQVSLDGDGLNGVDGGAPVSNNVTWAVSFHTASRGRSFRGRNYIVGLTGAALSTANEVLSSYAADWVTAYSALLARPFPAGQAWVVVSRFSGVDPTTKKPIPRVAGLATEVVSVGFSDLIIDSQRRRLPGRGL